RCFRTTSDGTSSPTSGRCWGGRRNKQDVTTMKLRLTAMAALVILLFSGRLVAAPKAAAGSKKEDQATAKELNQKVDDLGERVDDLSDQVEASKPGFIKFLMAGTYAADFAFDKDRGTTSLLLFRPHFYFLFGKKFFWEGDVDFRLTIRNPALAELFGEE